MSTRNVIAARDEHDSISWFRVADAKNWRPTTLNGGELFFVGGRWALLPPMNSIYGRPAKLIDDLEALEWFATNGYEPPDELKEYADARQLQ